MTVIDYRTIHGDAIVINIDVDITNQEDCARMKDSVRRNKSASITTSNNSTTTISDMSIPGTPQTVLCCSDDENEDPLFFFDENDEDEDHDDYSGKGRKTNHRDRVTNVASTTFGRNSCRGATGPPRPSSSSSSTTTTTTTNSSTLSNFRIATTRTASRGTNQSNSENWTFNESADNDCRKGPVRQRSRNHIRRLYGTLSSSTSVAGSEASGSSKTNRKLSITRVKDAWHNLVAASPDKSSSLSSSSSSPSPSRPLPPSGRGLFSLQYRNHNKRYEEEKEGERTYYYLKDHQVEDDDSGTALKSASKHGGNNSLRQVQMLSMPSLSSPWKNNNTKAAKEEQSFESSLSRPKAKWNQIVDGFRKESSPPSSLSAASPTGKATTTSPHNTDSDTKTAEMTDASIKSHLSSTSSSSHTSNRFLAQQHHHQLPPRLVALLQKGLYRSRNNDDDTDDDVYENDANSECNNPAPGSFAFAIGRGEF